MAGKVTLEARELLKEQGQFLGRDAWSRILHTDADRRGNIPFVPVEQGRTDDHGSRFGAILEGVGEEVPQYLAHELPICPDGQSVRNVYVETIRLSLAGIEVRDHVAHQKSDGDLPALRRRHLFRDGQPIEHAVDKLEEFFTASNGRIEKPGLRGYIQASLLHPH